MDAVGLPCLGPTVEAHPILKTMKNCPQCEDIPEIVEIEEGYSIKCPFCGFQTRGFTVEYDAVQAWDEVWDIIDMRSTVIAHALAEESDSEIRRYMRLSSLNIIVQYLQICHNEDRKWEELKGKLALQIKVTELSYDRMHKKIAAVRRGELG